MIPFQVNRVRAVLMLSLALGCAPANGTKQGAERGATARSDTAVVRAVTAPTDSDGVKADLARIQGSPTAPVWLIEVSDFQCPYCKQWHDESYNTIRKEYVNTGKVRFAYVNFPLSNHANAWPAAESAMCAGAQGKFFEMHDAIFANQAKWQALPSASPVFDSLARATGVDVSRWRRCVESGKMKPWIQADYERAQAAGASSTPSFLIGDKILEGAQPIGVLRSAIDSALAKSKKTTP